MPRIDAETKRQVGFTDSDGKYHALGDGEELVFTKQGKTREPIIKRADGSEVPFEEWKDAKTKGEQLVPAELRAKLNTTNIRDVIGKTTGKNERDGGNVLFGKDFSLDESHREQLRVAIEVGEALLKKDKEKPEWEAFQRLLEEGNGKGILMDFNFPPKWLVDGGESATVKKVRTPDGRPGIEVPSRVFQVYKWDHIIGSVRQTEGYSHDTLKGMSAKPLGNRLEELLDLFKKNGMT